MTDDPLTVTPIGVGASYGPPGVVQTCFLVRGAGRAVCLDLGAGALNRLGGHIAAHDLDLLVVTHLHPDHCIDLLALRVHMVWGPGAGRRLRVVGPPGLRERLAVFGDDGWDDAFEFQPVDGEMRVGDLHLVPAEVPHLPPTHAWRIAHGGRSMVFGADCGDNDALPRLASRADLLITECTMGLQDVPPGVPHLNATSAADIARRAGARRLLLTHCPPPHDRDAVLAHARARSGIPTDWAVQDTVVRV